MCNLREIIMKDKTNIPKEKKRIYCKDCRFLRQPIKEEDRRAISFFGAGPVFFCAAPRNLVRFSNFMSWELKRKLSPEYKNQENDCPDFETVEQALTQIKKV